LLPSRGYEVTVRWYRSNNASLFPGGCTQKERPPALPQAAQVSGGCPRWAAIAGGATAQRVDRAIRLAAQLNVGTGWASERATELYGGLGAHALRAPRSARPRPSLLAHHLDHRAPCHRYLGVVAIQDAQTNRRRERRVLPAERRQQASRSEAAYPSEWQHSPRAASQTSPLALSNCCEWRGAEGPR
jgi:hypothetical protein